MYEIKDFSLEIWNSVLGIKTKRGRKEVRRIGAVGKF